MLKRLMNHSLIPALAFLALLTLPLTGCQLDHPSIVHDPRPTEGYDSTDPASWEAWRDLMPGAPSKLHITGVVTVRATNYSVSLGELSPESPALHYELIVEETGEIGGQALTEQPLKFSAPDQEGFDTVVIHLPDGELLNLEIKSVQ